MRLEVEAERFLGKFLEFELEGFPWSMSNVNISSQFGRGGDRNKTIALTARYAHDRRLDSNAGWTGELDSPSVHKIATV